jgi:hypothetical protein
MTSTTTLRRAFAALIVINITGFLLALADHLPHASAAGIFSGTRTSTPAPILIVMALGFALSVFRARRAGALLAALPCLVSLAAVASDGDLGHAGLGGAEIAVQVANASVIAFLLAAAVARVGARGTSALARSAA